MAEPLFGNAIDYARIEGMVSQLVGAIASKPPSLVDDPVALRVEYQVAVDIIKLLTDIRFRCIVFVTAVITAAVTFANVATPGDPGARAAVGVLGFIATLGITIYELRNSQLYEAAMHRAKTLETRLQMKGSSPDGGNAGLFGERPPYVSRDIWAGFTAKQKREPPRNGPFMPFWFVSVTHDHGLALIYGAALGTWVYLFALGLLALPVPAYLWPDLPLGYLRLISALVGMAAGVWSIYQFLKHNDTRLKQPRPGMS